MSQFQVLYKRKIVPPTLKENLDIERRCNCLEFRRTKRSQAFDSRRGFVFEDPEPLEPVKTKVNPSVRKNKLHKYTTKKVAVKKQPPPFLVGKVRHKIHSPPFLHGPNVATEPKKRIPLTPIQSFAPKNYKFKANYISKAPVMAMTTTPSKLNNSPFTLESILNKNKNAKSNNKDKENYFKNVTVRSQRRRELKDSPTTMNQLVPGKPVFVFGRRNLEEEFKKLSKNPTKDSINFEMKTVKESQSSAKKENVFNMFNNVGKLSTKMAKVFSFETETIRLMNTEHQNHEDKSQMLSPNLSAIIYSPTDSTPIYSNKCHINVYTSPQTEKKDLAEKGSDNEDLNSDSTSPTLNQTAIDLDSTVNSASNQQISPAKNHQEYSPKLPDITSPTVISNKESDNKSDLEDNQYKAMSRSVENKTENHPCQPDLIELNLLEKISKTSMSDVPVSEDNVNLVVSASIETNSSDFNQPHKDVEVSGLDSLSRLSLSYPEKRENMGILRQSSQTQHQESNNVANEQIEILKTSMSDVLVSEDNVNLVVSASIETNLSDFNQPHKDVEVSGLDSLSRLSLSSPEKRKSTGIISQSPQTQIQACDNVVNVQNEILKTSVTDMPILEDNDNLVVSASIETNSSDVNQPHEDVEENELNSLSRLSLSSPEKRENMGILRRSSQTQHQESNNVANEQIEILKTSMSDLPVSEDNVNLVVSASIETNLSDFNQPHKDVEVSGLDSLSRLSLSSPEKRKSTGIISQSPQTQIQACDNVANVQNEILKTSVTDMPILEDNDNLVVSASIETNSSDVNQPHEDVEENELDSLSRLSLSSPEKRENMGILRRSSQTQHQESNNVANEQIEILKTSMSDLPVSEDNVNLVVSASIETNLSDFKQPHKDVEVSGLDSLSRLSLSSPEKRKSTGIISQSPQTQIQACDNVANVQNEILKTSVTGIPILEDNDNLVVSASIETNSSDFNQPHKDVEVSGLDSLSRLSLSYPEKREYVDISPQTPLAHLRASHNASSIQDVNVNIRKSDELTTFDTTRLSFSFKNMANETSSKQSHKKVAKTTSENNVLSQLSMSSLENKKNGTNLPKSSKFETRTCEENKSIDEKMPNLSHGSPRLPRSVKAVSSHAQLLEQSPVRVLRGRIIDVTPSPQRTPKKRNVTPCKSPYSLLSSKVYSPKHLAISPLKVLNLRNRDIAVTPSPTKLTPRKLRKPHTDVQEIDEDDSPIVLSINKTTKCKSLTSPQMESLISVEKNSTSKPEGNSPSKQINTQIPFSKNSSQVENVASMIKMNNKDLHAGTASAHSVVASPLIISLVESPIKKEPMSKPLIKYISSTVEDESTVQTIDLVSSDDEDEPSTLLKNILQKYSSINTPSPKSKGKSLTPTQKVPVDEEEHSTFLSNILKKYSSVNTPSPKSKDRSVLAPIGNLPIIRISPSRSPCLREVPSPQKIGSSPLRTLALRRRLVDLTPSPKKTPKKINVTPCKSPRPALHFTKESSPQQIESPLRVLCLRKRDVAVTPSPKKSTPRGRKK
ncbi:uncharacterized protein LOC100678812 isoform X2 [Nasonia vitripennis]|uniref:Uncharacterized protein n=1 Tax=Nasonia vitripennis TaxID=7425 RepID=A0A7M7IPH1_NASVI|nr:uncharacterized protein LOC100678812 isoform X2 [Nasonia vitripennis]